MIRVNLVKLLFDRRMTLGELAGRVGVSPANLSRLKTEKTGGLRFATLDALCRELACQPGDLFSYEAEKSAKAASRRRTGG